MGNRVLEQNKHAFLAPVATVLLIFFSLGVLLVAYYRISLDLKKSESYITQMKNLNTELLEKNRQLEISNEELDSFNHISSHDLQEPVRKIRTFISMIEEKDLDKISDKSKYIFERMELSAIRIQELLNDLLSYSQINKITQNVSPVDLNEVVEKIKIKLRELIEETGATITNTVLPVVNGDIFQLEQLFKHLIHNSLKYKKQDVPPQINIESHLVLKEHINEQKIASDNYHQIIISDNGIGFDQMYEHKVFELFAQLHANNNISGTGIGLTICKKAVQNHNGFIKVKSKPNEGTSFYIYLPA
jgi:light-regulated signal transduction histidine kinase (bacteriophytochrome)